MKRAIVLSGGGAKGAYQIGVWRALKELNIDYSIVTGTSVGALNGVFFVMDEYDAALKVWKNITYDNIYGDDFEKNMLNRDFMLGEVKKAIINGGMDITSLEKLFINNFNYDKMKNSNIDFGIVAFCLNTLKPVYKTKKQLNENNFIDYVLASASIFPAFKTRKIENKDYIDGGYYDQIPIDLAIKMGAEEVIAVDLKAPGIVRKVVKNKKVKIITISPNNELGSILKFDKLNSNRAITYGYNDTLKKYKKLEGRKYSFESGTLNKLYDKYSDVIRTLLKDNIGDISLLDVVISDVDFLRVLYDEDYKSFFNKCIESLLKMLKIDDLKIYDEISINENILINYNKKLSPILEKIYSDINSKKSIRKLTSMYKYEILGASYIKIIKEENNENINNRR